MLDFIMVLDEQLNEPFMNILNEHDKTELIKMH